MPARLQNTRWALISTAFQGIVLEAGDRREISAVPTRQKNGGPEVVDPEPGSSDSPSTPWLELRIDGFGHIDRGLPIALRLESKAQSPFTDEGRLSWELSWRARTRAGTR